MEVTYDITDLIHEGENEIMLWLGQGWGRIYGTPVAVKATVEKCVSDGECGLIYEILKTDSTWEAAQREGYNPKAYTITKKKVTSKTTLKLRMAPCGGFAVSIRER